MVDAQLQAVSEQLDASFDQPSDVLPGSPDHLADFFVGELLSVPKPQHLLGFGDQLVHAFVKPRCQEIDLGIVVRAGKRVIGQLLALEGDEPFLLEVEGDQIERDRRPVNCREAADRATGEAGQDAEPTFGSWRDSQMRPDISGHAKRHHDDTDGAVEHLRRQPYHQAGAPPKTDAERNDERPEPCTQKSEQVIPQSRF